jgi:putative ABC transport system permease protein
LLAFLTAVAFGVIPAWQAARLKIKAWLNENRRGGFASKSASRTRNTLVMAEVALSLLLLTGAGLMTRSLARLASEPLGYNADQALTLSVNLPAKAYPNLPQRIGFYERLLERVRALNGVQIAGASTILPVYSGSGNDFMIEGQPPAKPGALPSAGDAQISEDYFAAAGITLRTGRPFAPSDHAQSEPVAIINETLARRYFPNTDPLGKRIRRGAATGQSPWRIIVGVAGETKGATYGKLGWRAEPMIYEPLRQATGAEALTRGVHLFILPTEQASLPAAVFRAEIKAIDSRVPAPECRTMADYVARQLRQPRLQTLLSTSFALLALFLAVLGLYGVLSFSVAQRRPEIGLRLALGAQVPDVLRLIIGQGMRLALIGVGIGLLAAFWLTNLMAHLLYEVSANDPVTLVAAAFLLLGVALVACYLPARRATRINPMTALNRP